MCNWYIKVLSGDTKITPFLYNGQLGVMADDNNLYYVRARYYNVNYDKITHTIEMPKEGKNIYFYEMNYINDKWTVIFFDS